MSLFYSSLSSFSFSLIPCFVKTPLKIRFSLYLLTLSSINYHYNEDLNNINTINKKKILINELLDGLGIIMNCIILNFYNLCNFKQNLIQIICLSSYSILKFKYNNEIIKKIIYFSTGLRAIYLYPKSGIPLGICLLGYFDYLKRKKWNLISRIIWHGGNSIYIGYFIHKRINNKLRIH